MLPTLFVSDLHLPPAPSPLRGAFARWLRGPARGAQAVYLLGDLFDYWIGDDVGIERYGNEIQGLAGLTRAGVPVYLQRGNRDFFIGREFARATGVEILRDPLVVEVGNRRALLSHGDLFCTDDVSYQCWRRFSRIRTLQRLYLALPRGRRERIAGGLRHSANAHKRQKPPAIMDVSETAVRRAFDHYGVDLIIHGHTHRPGMHRYPLAQGTATRAVLPDWHDGAYGWLEYSDDKLHARSLSTLSLDKSA